MAFRISRLVAAAASVLIVGSPLMADTIQLVNGDRINGKVTSLDDKQIVLKSESFGELKIPRAKVELISLGEKGIPDFQHAAAPQQLSGEAGITQPPTNLNDISPLLQSPAVQQQLGPMIEQLLGSNGTADSQQNIDKARRGLHELRKDFGNEPEGKALDAYIRFFEQIAPAANLVPKKQAPPSPHAKRAPRAKPAEPSGTDEPNKADDAGKSADSKSSDEPAKSTEK